MVYDSAQRATEYVTDRVGDGLRTVVVVEEDGMEIEYLRDDLKREYSEESFADVVDTFRLEQPFMSPDLESRPVGERRAIVHYHENAFVLQFPLSPSESILISLTPESGRNLLSFIEKCHQLIHSEE